MARKPAGGMNLAVLRLEGAQTALDEVAQRLSLAVEQAWKKGEARRNGRRHRSSGLSATVADAPNGEALVAQLKRFLIKCKRRRISFSKIRAEISIGVSVGETAQYIGYVDLPPKYLAMLAECGLSLSVAAYPTSDARH